MEDGSDTSREGNTGFIGFRCSSDVKRKAERRAEQRGTSLSELMRQKLKETTEAAGERAATT
jgi:predicted HicB family RNase H-like nuclease